MFIKVAFLLVSLLAVAPALHLQANQQEGITDMDFLMTNGRDIRNRFGEGDIVQLRGVNVGGWLLQEFWMTPTHYSANANAEDDIIRILTERFGAETMYELQDLYRRSYFRPEYFDYLAEMGVNALRLPFWDRNLVDANGDFYENAFELIDWFIEESGKRGMYVILDFHGAPGSQSGSDHTGRDGGDNKEAASEFFFGPDAPANQELFHIIWEVIAERYKGNPVVAGFDILNEPFCTWRYSSRLSATELRNMKWAVYDEAYRRIRAIDPNRMLIMGATWDPVDLPHPDTFGWENVVYKYHNYAQGSTQQLGNKNFVIDNMRNKLNLMVSAAYEVPSYMGEFNFFMNLDAWDEGLSMFNELGISWTSWTFKTTPNQGNWGLFHHTANTSVNIETDTLERIREVWGNAGASVQNTPLIAVMTRHLKAPVTPNVLAPTPAALEEGEYVITGANTRRITAVNPETLLLGSTAAVFTGDAGQIFTIVVNGDGTFSLLSGLNGKYVSANPGNGRLYANAENIGAHEKFRIYQNGFQATIVSAANGQFVCSDENISGTPLIANRGSANAWEHFIITLAQDMEIGKEEPPAATPPTRTPPPLQIDDEAVSVEVTESATTIFFPLLVGLAGLGVVALIAWAVVRRRHNA